MHARGAASQKKKAARHAAPENGDNARVGEEKERRKTARQQREKN
jgi:hypothetical protein